MYIGNSLADTWGIRQQVGFESGFGFKPMGFGFGFGFKKIEVDSDSSGFGFEVPGFGSGFGFEMPGFAHHCHALTLTLRLDLLVYTKLM